MPTGQKTREQVIEEAGGEGIADQTLKPTPITEWGKKKKTTDGIILELPSGNVCKVRRTMDMLTMLQAGKIPNPLARVVNTMIDTGDTNFQKHLADAEDPEVMRQMFELINQTMTKVWMEPQVSAPDSRKSGESWDEFAERVKDWEADEGTLSVFDIEMEDKMYVFAVAQGAAADLERFRREQESALESVQASEGVVKPTKRTGGARSKK